MTTGHSDYDSQKLRQLASSLMDGIANEQQLADLTEILRSSEDARDEYLALVDMHAVLLETESSDLSSILPSGERRIASADRRFSGRQKTVLLTLIVCCCAVVGWFLQDSENPESVVDGPQPTIAVDDSFVSVVQENNVVWATDSAPFGDRIGKQRLHFMEGFLRLQFDSGVEVTLQGPADFEVVSPEKVSLLAGVFTADVPPGAEGFTLKTPNAEVVDLGTSFGVELTESGDACVSVFEGEVTVAPRESSETRHLKEGEAVRVGVDQRMESVEFDVSSYEKLWPIASGIVSSTDVFQFVPPWPARIRFVASDDDVFVAAEGRSHALTDELQVNISTAGDYVKADELTPATIQPGRRIRSYVLHYRPVTQRRPRQARRVKGALTFDRPVIGLIVQQQELMASGRRFRRRGVGGGNQRRQLDLTGESTGDRISLSKDRRTVSVDLISQGRTSDLIRVIVDDSVKRPRGRRRSQRRLQ